MIWKRNILGRRVFTLLLLACLASCTGVDSPDRVAQQFVITPPPSASLANVGGVDMAISPDGSQLVYVADLENTRQLFRRDIDEAEATPIPGTEGVGGNPFFSPDDGWVAFFAAGRLKKVSLAGGEPIILCDAPASRGGSWGSDDTIVFAATPGRVTAGEFSLPVELYRVPASGGDPETLAVPDPSKGEREYRWPQILPGGKAVLFTLFGRDGFQVAVLSLGTGEHRIIVKEGRNVRYATTGHLVYGLDETLMAVPFDLERLEVTGSPVPILEQVREGANTAMDYAFSGSETLVYVPKAVTDSGANQRRLVWVDRQGTVEPLSLEPSTYRYPRLSPDGQRLIAAVGIPVLAPHIWLYDLTSSSAPTPLTYDGGNTAPIWTPDGRRVTFASSRRGQLNLFWRVSDSKVLDPPEWLLTGDYPQRPLSWSPDGNELIFSVTHPLTGLDLSVLDLREPNKPRPLIETRFNEFDATLSPDGRWMAYVSDVTVDDEVYVLPYPRSESDLPKRISTQGGANPAWAPDGRELLYLQGNKMMGVRILQTRPRFTWATPEELFEGRFLSIRPRSYDIAPDGRFLMVEESGLPPEPGQLNVVPNWFEELESLAPKN